ncbi:AsnC family transcriptional regulator [Marinomonas sp. GJ51-6]|uniref:AsnC family transcriptional regulator n=1 Tax=Marinomonas sp. GJ51-6 TaxID=2992802 RepID=UPI00397738F5
MHLDDVDLQLLALIQSDDSISTEAMAKQVGLSKTPAGDAFKSSKKPDLSNVASLCWTQIN